MHPHIPIEVNPAEPELLDIDEAIAREDADRSARRAARVDESGRLVTLPWLLRWIGGALLVVAGFTFMMQNWEHADDLSRYYHFLVFTGALTVAGFVCGIRIRDEKGARTFLGLAAAAVPVHFTVLGAILYSQFPWLSGFAEYPGYAHFAAPHPTAALLTTAIGVAALLPVCWTAFLTLARPEAPRLVAAYLLANATLLVPTRHPDVIGLVALALLAAQLLFDKRVLAAARGLRTREGRYVRLLMTVPFAVLIGRTFNLYDPSSLFFAACAASAAVTLFTLAPAVSRSEKLAVAAQYLALLPAAVACVALSDAAITAFRLGLAFALPLVCLTAATVQVAMSLFAIDGGARMRRIAAMIATGGMAIQLVMFPGVLSSVGCLATAIVAVAYGYAAEQRSVFATGAAALLFGLAYHLRYAAELYALSPWASLAGLGIATVVVGSLIERHHRSFAAHAAGLRERFGGRRAHT